MRPAVRDDSIMFLTAEAELWPDAPILGGTDPDARDAMRNAARVGAVGIEFATSVLVCFLAGWYADERFQTSPWLALLGFVLGCVVGFRLLFRAAKVMGSNEGDEEDSDL